MRFRYCFVIIVLAACTEVSSNRPTRNKTKVVKSGKRPQAQSSGDYVTTAEVVEEVELTDRNGGDYVVQEEVVYVDEPGYGGQGETGYGPGTVTEVVYVDEDVNTGEGENHVITVNRDDYQDGQDVIVLDGTEVIVDNTGGNDDVIVVVDGDYDYGSNGEEEEIVLIIDDDNGGVPRETIWYTSSTPFPYWTSPPQTYPPWTYPTTTYPPWTYPTTTYPPWTYPTTTYPPWTYPTTTYPPWTYPTTTPPPWTYPTAPNTTPWTFPTTTNPPWTYPTAAPSTTTQAPVPTPWTYPPSANPIPSTTISIANSSCGCTMVINNNNYNYFNQGGVPGHAGNHTHVTTTVIHKYPQGKPGRPGNRTGRKVIKRIGSKQRLANTGNGARRRLYTRKILPKNLGVASGAGNVQVYRILKTGNKKKQLVKNLRKRPMQVFKVKPAAANRNNTVTWKVVPRWKAQRMQKLGTGVKIGQVQQRRVVTPGVRKANQRIQQNKLRFNNRVMRMNKKTGNNFGLQDLDLGLQNRLVKRKVRSAKSTPRFVRKFN